MATPNSAALLHRDGIGQCRTIKPRRREIDLAIAACAMVHDASLWTLNPEGFDDIQGLKLVER
jgi:predicted nucleic acid-binding protein